jgi:hypothetical protein
MKKNHRRCKSSKYTTARELMPEKNYNFEEAEIKSKLYQEQGLLSQKQLLK